MENAFRKILEEAGEDLNREGLVDTPRRAAKAFEFLTKGYKEDVESAVNGAVFETDNDEMIIVKEEVLLIVRIDNA